MNRVPLAEVLLGATPREKLQQGWSPQCEKLPAPDGNWGVLKTTAVQLGTFLESENKRLPDHLDPKPRLEVSVGDVLMTCAGPRSRCGVPTLVRSTRPRLMISGKIYRLRPDPLVISAAYLELFLLSHEAQQAIESMKTGISDSGLNLTKDRLLPLPVPLPALQEQHRIVEILEDHLSRLNAADASLLAAKSRTVAQFRSTLATVFAGSHSTATLGSMIKRIEAGRSFGGSAAPARNDQWGIIKVSAMTWGVFRPDENKAVPGDRVDRRHEIRSGDLLVSRANTSSYVGAAVLVGETRSRLLLSDKSLRLVPMEGIDREWLQAALSAPSARKQISALATGTKDSMRNISQVDLRSVELPGHSRQEQAAAVSRIREVREHGDRIAAALATARRRSTALRRALLDAAFSGRLTGHDSELDLAGEAVGA